MQPGFLPPLINDITTDPDDPPRFVHALRDGVTRNRDMSYPGGRTRARQLAAYPDIKPWRSPDEPDAVFDAVEAALRALGLEICDLDRPAGRIEARARTRLLRFVDDVVVRVTPEPPGTRVDIRSRSRVGLGDLGTNARRIRRILAAARQALS